MDLVIFDTVYALGRSRSVVPFSAIPEPLQEDFAHFMMGRACVMRDGEMVAYSCDFNEWLHKLSQVGVQFASMAIS